VDISNVDISGVEKTLLSIHTHLAALTKTPELELESDEASKLAKAGLNVYKHYSTYFPQISEKQIDVGFALTALYQVYGTRLAAIGLRKKIEAEMAREKAKEAINSKPFVKTPPGFNPPDPMLHEPKSAH
jgi:hypothetical protein